MLTPLTFELVILTLTEVEGEESPYLLLHIQPVKRFCPGKRIMLTQKGLPYS
jgi:hypothetical protein